MNDLSRELSPQELINVLSLTIQKSILNVNYKVCTMQLCTEYGIKIYQQYTANLKLEIQM